MIAPIIMLPLKKPFDIESLREPGEARMLRRTLCVLAVVYLGAIGITLSFFAFWLVVACLTVMCLRQKYLAEAIEVDAAQLPHVHRLVRECAERLGVEAPLLFISSDPGSWPVFTIPLPRPAILLNASWIKMLEEDELAFFIFHELAHGKLGHRRYLNPINVLENVGAMSWLLTTPLEIMRYLMRPWARLADFSADRIALACLDGRIEIAASALVKVTAGDEMYDRVSAGAFIAQARRLPDSWLLTAHEVCTAKLGSARRVSRLLPFADSQPLKLALGRVEEARPAGWISWVTGGFRRPVAQVTQEPPPMVASS